MPIYLVIDNIIGLQHPLARLIHLIDEWMSDWSG